MINQDAVSNLSGACQPATFGLNKEDVLDETYRKAGKLDGDKIAWRFNPSDKDGFVNQVASTLFPWETLKTGIRFELYKLNVYGDSYISVKALLSLLAAASGKWEIGILREIDQIGPKLRKSRIIEHSRCS